MWPGAEILCAHIARMRSSDCAGVSALEVGAGAAPPYPPAQPLDPLAALVRLLRRQRRQRRQPLTHARPARRSAPPASRRWLRRRGPPLRCAGRPRGRDGLQPGRAEAPPAEHRREPGNARRFVEEERGSLKYCLTSEVLSGRHDVCAAASIDAAWTSERL